VAGEAPARGGSPIFVVAGRRIGRVRPLSRVLDTVGYEVCTARSARAASMLVERAAGAVAGAVVDCATESGPRGFGFVRALRHACPLLPVLAIVERRRPKPAVLDELASMGGAEIATDPCSPIALVAFARRAALAWMAAQTAPTPRELMARLGLRRRQAEVLALAVRGCDRAQIARALCISVATVKDHVTTILKATGEARLARLLRRLRQR
jgi:DNA-binding NarL/FixJ family response regulator